MNGVRNGSSVMVQQVSVHVLFQGIPRRQVSFIGDYGGSGFGGDFDIEARLAISVDAHNGRMQSTYDAPVRILGSKPGMLLRVKVLKTVHK